MAFFEGLVKQKRVEGGLSLDKNLLSNTYQLFISEIMKKISFIWRCKHGFNLIENALVLGVAGIIIGGAWIAASTVIYNTKIKRTIEGILFIHNQGLRSLNSTMYTGTYYNITSSAIKMGILPADWVTNGAMKHPLGGPGYVSISGNPYIFEVGLSNINQTDCIKLMSGITSRFRGNTELSAVMIVDAGGQALVTSYPVPPTHNICSTTVREIDFWFKLP